MQCLWVLAALMSLYDMEISCALQCQSNCLPQQKHQQNIVILLKLAVAADAADAEATDVEAADGATADGCFCKSKC